MKPAKLSGYTYLGDVNPAEGALWINTEVGYGHYAHVIEIISPADLDKDEDDYLVLAGVINLDRPLKDYRNAFQCSGIPRIEWRTLPRAIRRTLTVEALFRYWGADWREQEETPSIWKAQRYVRQWAESQHKERNL